MPPAESLPRPTCLPGAGGEGPGFVLHRWHRGGGRHPLARQCLGGAAGPAPPNDGLGVYVWDAATGDLAARHDVGGCGGRY